MTETSSKQELPTDAVIIKEPLVIMYREESGGSIVCNIHPASDIDHKGYGLIICDLVRHVANAFDVDENDVWEWVDKERHHHTTPVTRAS